MQEKSRHLNSAISDIVEFNGMARELERSVARRKGKKLLPARDDVAKLLDISTDTIEGFRAMRTKIVPAWLKDRVRNELISALQKEIQYLEHEINLHRQAGAHGASDALASAEAHVVAVREILAGEMK